MDHSRVPAGALSSRVNIENCCPSSPCVSIRGDWIRRRAGPHGMPNRSRSKPAEYLPGRPLSCINIRYTTFLFDLHVSDALIIWSRPLGNNAYFDRRTHVHMAWIVFFFFPFFKSDGKLRKWKTPLSDHLKNASSIAQLSVRCILRDRIYIQTVFQVEGKHRVEIIFKKRKKKRLLNICGRYDERVRS